MATCLNYWCINPHAKKKNCRCGSSLHHAIASSLHAHVVLLTSA